MYALVVSRNLLLYDRSLKTSEGPNGNLIFCVRKLVCYILRQKKLLEFDYIWTTNFSLFYFLHKKFQFILHIYI